MNSTKQINNDYSPKSANAGMNFSPYQVPNVAKIPTPNRLSNKQVSFAGNGRQVQKSPLPTGITQGMGYLADARGRGGSPLRNHSPRREESYSNLPPQLSQQDFGARMRHNSSPLRGSSPRKEASPMHGGSAA